MSKIDCQIVLDRSGSMATTWDDTIGALNAYIKELAKDGTNAKISVMSFDSQSIDTLRDVVPVAACPVLRFDEAPPRSATPLFDAVGKAVDGMRNRKKKHRKALVIMTDGLENSSTEYTKEAVQALLRSCEKDDWLITYLGAGHDAWAQGMALGIDAGKVANYSKCFEADAMGATLSSVRSYAAGATAMDVSFSEADRAKMSGR